MYEEKQTRIYLRVLIQRQRKHSTLRVFYTMRKLSAQTIEQRCSINSKLKGKRQD